MSKWEIYDFNDVIFDDTKNGTKIKKENYLSHGLYPVVDQGQEHIAGFLNSPDGLYEDVPAIIFGDHTRIIKHVDFPFFLGADGVKLLKVKKDNVDYRFLYYYFIKNEIPNTGYNRHFKWLKELKIPLPPLEIQKKVAEILNFTAELINTRKKQLIELDNFVKSTFYDLFGDPMSNDKGWEIGKIINLASEISYGTSGKASTDKLSFPILRMNNITYQGEMDLSDLKYIELSEKEQERFLVHKGELLFNRTNSKELVGKTAVFREETPMAYAGYLVRLVPNERANSDFISGFLNSIYGKKLLFKMAKNIVGMANINAKEMGNIEIYIPPIELQNKYAEIVTKIEEQKFLVKKAIDETQQLFDSLMSKYFDN